MLYSLRGLQKNANKKLHILKHWELYHFDVLGYVDNFDLVSWKNWATRPVALEKSSMFPTVMAESAEPHNSLEALGTQYKALGYGVWS